MKLEIVCFVAIGGLLLGRYFKVPALIFASGLLAALVIVEGVQAGLSALTVILNVFTGIAVLQAMYTLALLTRERPRNHASDDEIDP